MYTVELLNLIHIIYYNFCYEQHPITSVLLATKISLGWCQGDITSVLDYNNLFDARIIVTEACGA